MCLTTKIISKKLFQFHKGTIRTGKEYFGMLYDNNFNSIKVRLEHSHEDEYMQQNPNFNSIKVRLERLKDLVKRFNS